MNLLPCTPVVTHKHERRALWISPSEMAYTFYLGYAVTIFLSEAAYVFEFIVPLFHLQIVPQTLHPNSRI